MIVEDFIQTLNQWGSQKIPFLFMVDFEMKKPVALQLSEIDSQDLLYDLNGVSNAPRYQLDKKELRIKKYPIGIDDFKTKFSNVLRHLEYGDSYLTNLTIRTELVISHRLRDLFFLSRAKYKLLYKNDFLVFSPETFVQIRENKIFSYPMKGTIDASIPGAKEIILNDIKELAEHVTIVDLIRNDLSQIAKNVRVNRFRYIDELKTSDKKLLQVSSEISGELENDYASRLGKIVIRLLPAGSVSGAPKAKTLKIIHEAEEEDRGYYTGVFGLFDGKNFDSGVMIRYIEQTNGKVYYRSGGGITTQSILEKEYQEAIDKVYVPLD